MYRAQYEAMEGLDNLAGTFPWLLYDFASPRRLNAFQRGLNRKGLITRDRKHRKLGFDTVAEVYRSVITNR